jgi:hypothetical protein
MTRTPKWAKRLVIPVLVMLQAACATTTYSAIAVSDIPRDTPSRLKVTTDSLTVELKEAEVLEDTLLTGKRANQRIGESVRVTVPVSSIQTVELGDYDQHAARTALGVVGILAGTLFVIGFVAFAVEYGCEGKTKGIC